MTQQHIRSFITSATARLAATYLAIIMFMCVGFSIVLYNTSSHELGRQLPPKSYFSNRAKIQNNLPVQTRVATGGQSVITNPDGTTETSQLTRSDPSLNDFLNQRIEQGRRALIIRLFYLNIGALLLGSIVSYVLARRSLEPIEASMEAQAQFVNDASHELRTPLTAIQTSNEVFLRRAKPTISDAKKLIVQNTEDVKRLKVLSDGLLNLAQHKHTMITTTAVKLHDVVSDAATQIIPQASEKSITFDDQVAKLTVQADKATLTQALIIILDNAVKYSEPKKSVSLTTRTKGKYVFLDVKDEGIGIRASDVPHLFRRFYRADSARSDSATNGYGLGLAIAKQIMVNQHGNIEAVSNPGTGSTFSLKIPSA